VASGEPERAAGLSRAEQLSELVGDLTPLRAAPVSRRRVDPNAHIRILIADDHPIFRYGLRSTLTTQADFTIVGETSNGDETIAIANALKPDVVLLDFSMPGCPAHDVLQRLREDRAVRTILLTGGVGRSDIVDVLKLGARGVILKDAPVQQLFTCIRAVFNGDFWVRRQDFAHVVEALVGGHDDKRPAAGHDDRKPKPPVHLTARERDVLALVASGETNRGIARKLAVSEDTVKHHVTNILDKTGMSSRVELTLFAIEHRLVKSA
jgi:two-component system, NarL family, nitrate/nitrite response regulator NarL